MKNKRSFPRSKATECEEVQPRLKSPPLVNAEVVGAQYGVTGRYILQLAAEGRIPCLRLGRKCVRFDPLAVATAFADPNFGKNDGRDDPEI